MKKTNVMLIALLVMSVLTTGMCIFIVINGTAGLSSKTDIQTETDSTSDDNNEIIKSQITDELGKLENEAYNRGASSVLDKIKPMMENGTSTLRMLRELYPEYLIYNETGGYIFKPIDNSLKMNNFKKENFYITAGDNQVPTSVEYYENSKLASSTGIDVSKHQGNIDWAKVKAAGIDFAIIRAGNRGYGTDGKLLADDNFAANAQAATDNGIKIGAYIFSEAVTKEEAVEEAELVLKMIKPYKITYPVVIDIEEVSNDTGRNESLSVEDRTDIVVTFCEKIKKAGYTPMIYGNLKSFIGMLDMKKLENYEKWYAYYGDDLYFPYAVSMWQYTSKGKVDGISGDVDLNISFKNYD